MRTMGNMLWATVGVGAVGVGVGVGLMMAGDWLGRRDEEALRVAVPAPITQSAPEAGAGSEEVSRALTTLQKDLETPSLEALALASQAVTVVSDQERLVNRQQILEAMQGNPFRLLSQARLVPHLDGPRSGLRVASVTDSPWMEKVGVEAGDVVTAINGKPVLDPRKMGAIAGDLFSASEVAITIQRAGQEKRLQYHMQPTAQAPISQGSP